MRGLIRAARHKTAEEIRQLLADRKPKPDVADCVRRVASGVPALSVKEAGSKLVLDSDRAVRATGDSMPRGPSSSTTAPLGGERYRVRFTAEKKLHAQLQELRALMRHQVPDGDLARILGRAIALLLDHVRKRKFAAVSTPKPASPANETPPRRIPAAIRRAAARRDGARCSYISASGRKCGSQEFLEFRHLEPWARTGTHSIDGIALR